MAQERFEIRHIGLDYICDACGIGRMRPCGPIKLIDPPKIPHRCTECGAAQDFDHNYPTPGWQRVEPAHADSEPQSAPTRYVDGPLGRRP